MIRTEGSKFFFLLFLQSTVVFQNLVCGAPREAECKDLCKDTKILVTAMEYVPSSSSYFIAQDTNVWFVKTGDEPKKENCFGTITYPISAAFQYDKGKYCNKGTNSIFAILVIYLQDLKKRIIKIFH